jgi:hypothetical protein
MKESYFPSPEEIKKAGGMMSEEEKNLTEERENVEGKYEVPKTFEECKELLRKKMSLIREVERIGEILSRTPADVATASSSEACTMDEALAEGGTRYFSNKDAIINYYRQLGVDLKVDPDVDVKKTEQSYRPWQLNSQDVDQVFRKNGWKDLRVKQAEEGDEAKKKTVFIKISNKEVPLVRILD